MLQSVVINLMSDTLRNDRRWSKVCKLIEPCHFMDFKLFLFYCSFNLDSHFIHFGSQKIIQLSLFVVDGNWPGTGLL